MIVRTSLSQWDTLTYDATCPPGTAVVYDILDIDYNLLAAGLTSGSNLHDFSITSPTIRLRCNLSTADGFATPVAHSARVTWLRHPDHLVESRWSAVLSSMTSGTWHVDDATDALEDGSVLHPFDAIQEAIDAADAGETVIVHDGTFSGVGNRDIDFRGKALAVRSASGPDHTTIDCGGAGRGFVFHSGEGLGSLLEGVLITNGAATRGTAIACAQSGPLIRNCMIVSNTASAEGGAIHCDASSPRFVNCTITGNSAPAGAALACSSASQSYPSSVTLASCIVWNGADSFALADESVLAMSYCCVQSGFPGIGVISQDPLFINPTARDFHLLSEFGRWDRAAARFVCDDATSPYIDAGDPAGEFSREPQRNGGRVNMGAFGNTREASRSRLKLVGDVNDDCKVNLLDLLNVRDRVNTVCPQ